MKRVILILIAIISSFPINSASISKEMLDNPFPSVENLEAFDFESRQLTYPGIEINLMTTETGDEVYSYFGHTSLEVRIPGYIPLFYDYGYFSFSDGFYLDFVLGRLFYNVYATDGEMRISGFKSANRTVHRTPLDLSPKMMNAILEFLSYNTEPENNTYLYDYYLDNCATRVRDIYNEATGGEFKRWAEGMKTGSTLRKSANLYLDKNPIVSFTLSYLQGPAIDKPITLYEECFLPLSLMKAIESFEGVESTTVYEAEGRKIILSNPKSEGRIVQESFADVEVGTRVIVKFPLRCILNVQKELNQFPTGDQEYERYAYKPLENSFSDGNYFDAQAMQEYVFAFVYNYVSTYFCNTLIPIRVISKYKHGKKIRVIKNETISKYNRYDREKCVRTTEIDISGRHYYFFYDCTLSDRKKSMIWCDEDASMAVIEYAPQTGNVSYMSKEWNEIQESNKINKRGFVCFKNVRVNRELSVKAPYSSFYNVFEDFMGLRAEEILKVHREEFSMDFSWRTYADRFFQAYYKCLNVLGTDISRMISNSESGGENISVAEKRQLEAIAEELSEPVAQIIQLLYLGIPLIEVNNSEIMDQVEIYKEKGRVLLVKYAANKEVIDLANGMMSLTEILERLNEVLAYDEKTQEEQPCIFIKAITAADALKYSLIGSKAKLDLLLQKKPEAIGFWAEEYFKEVLNEFVNEPFDAFLKNKLQRKFEERLYKERDERQQKLLESLDKSGVILTDNNVVKLIEEYNGFKKEFFRLSEAGPTYAKITKKIQEANPVEKIEFYRRSYNRKEFSPIFSARDILEYPELIVKELPIVEEANVVESGYIISPISKEIFDSVENAQLKADMKGGIEIDCSEFTDIVINHSSYKALEQWVFDNQLGIGEKKYSKADIGRTYLRYIQKIYEVNKSPG